MTVTDSQLTSLQQLCGEIEGIDRAAREPAPADGTQPAGAVSYSFGLFSGFPSISSAEQTVADIVAAVRSTLAKLAPVATLETYHDGLRIRTTIQYRGRVATVLCGSSSPDGSTSGLASVVTGEHVASLEKTYALRAAFAAAMAAVGGALVSISMAVANPLTALHALASARALKQALDRLAAAVEAAG